MATAKVSPGTAFQGPDGHVAVRMGPGVTVGKYFLIHPDHGGHYESGDEAVKEIEGWPKLAAAQTKSSRQQKEPSK